MPIEPWLLLAGPEVAGIAGLSGLVVTGSFALVYKIHDSGVKERIEERRVRATEAAANLAAAQALNQANAAMERLMTSGGERVR